MEQKNKSLKQIISASLIKPLIIPAILILVCCGLIPVYIILDDITYLYILIGAAVILIASYIIYSVITFKRMYRFYKTMLDTTEQNLNSISTSGTSIRAYDSGVKELEELNSNLVLLKGKITNSTLISGSINYDVMPLEYVEGFDKICTFDSFNKNLDSIIFNSNNFRNLFVEIFYEFELDNKLTNENIGYLQNTLKSILVDYQDILYVLREDRKSIICYIPRVDTFERIKEQFNNFVDELSICQTTSEGVITTPCKIAAVCYPYSELDELVHDLAYAKNSSESINFYFPERISNPSGKVRYASANLNIISKVIESLGGLHDCLDNIVLGNTIITSGLKELSTFLNIDYAGYIDFDENAKRFNAKINICNADTSLYIDDEKIDARFIKNMNKYHDFDQAYYFSTRNHANREIGIYLDKYDINSGFYFVVKDEGQPKGAIYFFNRVKDLVLDTYLREALALFASKVSDYYYKHKQLIAFNTAYEDMHNILKLADQFVYRIDRESHEIISYSKNAPIYFPDIKEKELCYKCIHGLDKPCPDCPLLTGKKMLSSKKKCNFETSLNMVYENGNRYVPLYVKSIYDQEETFDFYHKDWLVNSYPVLVNELESSYSINGKGYVLLLRMDNIDDLLQTYGSEQVLIGIRNFCKDIKNSNMGIQNIFYYNAHTIALLFKELGQIDIINRCENIYELSKKKYVNPEKQSGFTLTYLAMNYPSGYPTSTDFLKHCSRYIQERKAYEYGKDYIIFEENNYIRPASRKDFMLSVIDDKFGNSTFKAMLQPYVNAKDRSVFGAEMLLRLTDDYRNIVFNADELIHVAAANGKISMISDALVDYIGNLFKKEGSSIFKVFGLKRLSINTDFSYFQSEESVHHLISFISEYNFPKNFLGFEINEWDIKAHYAKFKEIAPRLIDQNITLICDQYSGKDLTVQKLKELGFSEIKIGRSLGGFIDTDPQKRRALLDIMENAKSLGMQTTVVGIENIEQYDIVRNADNKAMLQGYYFYKPLEKNDLINALRASNSPLID